MRESFQGTLQSQCSNTILRASLPPLQLLQGILTSLEVAKSNVLKFTKKCVFASNSCVLTIFGGIPKWKRLLLRNFRKVIFILQLTQKWLKRNFLEQKHIFFRKRSSLRSQASEYSKLVVTPCTTSTSSPPLLFRKSLLLQLLSLAEVFPRRGGTARKNHNCNYPPQSR